MIRSRLTIVLVTAALVFPSIVASAQDEGPTPLTWVGSIKLQPGAGPQFEKVFETYDQPLFDRLVAEGEGVSWGLGYELAGPGGFDYVIWISAPGWAGIGTIEAMFDARYEGMSEDDLAEMIAAWTAVIAPEEDQVQLLRHVVVNTNPEADSKYLRLSYYKVKPGRSGELVKMYKSYWVPLNEQLLESGVISAYGLIEQAIHTDSSFTHQAWIEFNSLADLDRIDKAIEEADAEVSEGDRMARELAFMKTVETGAHFDRLIRKLKQGG